VKYISKSVNEIGKSCLLLLPLVAAEKLDKFGFAYSKAYIQKRKYVVKIFFYIPTGLTFMYITLKTRCCSFILSMLFHGETEMRHTFCAGHTSCAAARRWLTDDISQNIFPITPPKTC
jgi:hypothetical protein